MSISSSNRKAGPFACNGAMVAFPFSFKVFTTADVRVVLTDSNSIESDLALGTNYTVALNADQDTNPGGTVTTTATYATGYKITLTSQVQNLQPVTLTNQGGFYPKVINDALDRLTIMAQQLAEQVGRAVKTSISSGTSPDSLISTLLTAVSNALTYSNNASSSATAAANSATAASGSATSAANSAASIGFTLTDLQTQGKTAVTSAGTAPNFTAATSPAYGALAAGQRMRVKFHAVGTTGSNTLNRDGLGAKNLMQYDSAGAKVAAVIAANMLADVEYDGTDMVILDPLPPTMAGEIAFFARNTAPTGYMKANGAAVSRSTYAALFAAIGTTFGAGDGSTTFNLPDLRGEFVRGWDDSRGVDSGRSFGTAQSQDVQAHNHSIRASVSGFTGGNPGVLYAAGDNNGNANVAGGGTTYGVQNSTGTETRPRNVALLACIKY